MSQSPTNTSVAPRVSVVIPAYNARSTIARGLASVFSQQYRDFEVIVVDDGSSDGTAEYLRKVYGSSLQVVSQTNRGAAAARNLGASLARGHYIAFLDADDEWHVEKLARQVAQLDRAPNAALCATRWTTHVVGRTPPFNARTPIVNCTTQRLETFQEVFLDPYFGTPSVVMPRSVFERCGGFDESLPTAEDIDLWIRASLGGPILRLSANLAGVNRSLSSLSSRRADHSFLDNLRVIEMFATAHPDIYRKHEAVFHAARAHVNAEMSAYMIERHQFSDARKLLCKSVFHHPHFSRLLYQILRSFAFQARAILRAGNQA